jgi:hypothetical protein
MGIIISRMPMVNKCRQLLLIRSTSCFSLPSQVPCQLFLFRPSTYPVSSTLKSTSAVTNRNLPSTPNYSSSSRSVYNSNHAVGNLRPSFQTFHPNQQQYQQPGSYPIYQPQMPMPTGWLTNTNAHAGGLPRNQGTSTKHRAQSRDRGSSVERGPRNYPPANTYTARQHHYHHHQPQQQQQQPQAQKQVIVPPLPPQTGPAGEHFYQHRHHHHRGYPATISNNPMAVPTIEVTKESTGLPVESIRSG